MNESFQDLFADLTEVGLDTLQENEIIKEIPILGSVVNIARGVNSYRERVFLNKIKIFVEKIGTTTEEQRKRLVDESQKSEQSKSRLGDAVFTTIEQSDSVFKIELMAVAFEAFLKKEFDEYYLRSLSHIIKNTFSDDLRYIIETKASAIDYYAFVGTGLVDSYSQPTKSQIEEENHYKDLEGLDRLSEYEPEAVRINYKLSKVAEHLRRTWSKYGKKND